MLCLAASFSLGAPASTGTWLPESHDAVTSNNKVCGIYGDPHFEQSNGVAATHMGGGEYSLISLPTLGAEVHYYGCGSTKSDGTFVGALAIKIGDKTIEIVGNDLSVVGGDQYEIDYDNDKVMGPFEVSATSTTIMIERQVTAVENLSAAQTLDKKKEAAGEMLYKWTVTTPEGFQLHSHASPARVAEGGWMLDVHINYPDDKGDKANGLCVDDCATDPETGADDCAEASSCKHVNSSATFGIAPIFSAATLSTMGTTCPHTQPDYECAPQATTGPEACEKENITIHDASVACVHLSAMSDQSYYDACIYDYCMLEGDSSSATAAEEWYKEHNPPDDVTCKVVADPHFTSFDAYKFGFAGDNDGAYEILKKESTTDPCEIEIQSLECSAPCPGSRCGQSYVYAIGVKALGGDSTHELIFSKDSCTIDGAACDSTKNKNVGKDGVKLVPYSPVAGALGYPNMGEFGPGVHGWYVAAGGFHVNVTMTLPTEPGQPGPFMMNVIVAAPPMCTSSATGLCKTSADTADKLLQSFGDDYYQRSTSARHVANTNAKRAAKGEQQLAPTNIMNEPELKTYPALGEANTLAGLKLLSCPA